MSERKCSLCKNPGHNKKNCPNVQKKQSENVVNNIEQTFSTGQSIWFLIPGEKRRSKGEIKKFLSEEKSYLVYDTTNECYRTIEHSRIYEKQK